MAVMLEPSESLPKPPGFIVIFANKSDAWPEVERLTGAVRSASLHRDNSSADILPPRVEGGAEIHVYSGLGAAAMDLSDAERGALEDIGATVVENVMLQLPPTRDGNEMHAFDQVAGTAVQAGANTWGVSAIGAPASNYTGRGVRVAVIDTGVDLSHPDLAGRVVAYRSFVPGAPDVADGDGHGTHVAGTIGARPNQNRPRYSVAPGCDLIVAKVLDDQGRGYTDWILDGMNWAALQEDADILNLSLGGPRATNAPFNRVYEDVVDRLLDADVLTIAAAGNDSNRPAYVAPLGNPAACPSVDAVVAVDQVLRIASFSCEGDKIANPDHAGPGVDVFSSWRGGGYRTISGTSMASPHVAGIAALLAEASGDRGRALRARLARRSTLRPLGAPPVYGHGFTTCP